MLRKNKYLEIIQEVKGAEKVEQKTHQQQRRIKLCSVLEFGGVKKLVAQNEGNANIKYTIFAEEL